MHLTACEIAPVARKFDQQAASTNAPVARTLDQQAASTNAPVAKTSDQQAASATPNQHVFTHHVTPHQRT